MGKEQKPKLESRLHPDLRALQSEQFTYAGWQKDQADAEHSHYNWPGDFQGKIDAMRRKQRVHDGDRSHPDLQTLDAIPFSYSGWRKDKAEAERLYYNYPILVKQQISTMRKKQSVHDGDRSHPDLRTLDSVQWSYEGWQKDKADVEENHFSSPILVEGKISAMRNKQRVHDGDRSHPNLQILDGTQWSYSNWRKDKADAEYSHYSWPADVEGKIDAMRKKQRVHDGDRSHPDLRRIDAMKCTYPGWQKDKADAEDKHYNWPILVDCKILTMRKKQAVHDGDRSHPDLLALDSISWSYLGWQKDKADVEENHFNCPILVQGKISAMRNKQRAHEGSSSCPIVLTNIENDTYKRPAKKQRTHVPSRLPKEDTSSKCVVCLKLDATHTLKPCNHRCVCKDCATWALVQKQCPYCRLNVTSYIVSVNRSTSTASTPESDAPIDLSK